MKQINTGVGKPGLDGLPVELLKGRNENVMHALSDLIIECWNGSPLPNDWVDGTLLCLYKSKGKKEFMTTTVELLFWKQLVRLLPGSCGSVSFGTYIVQSFQNHKVILHLGSGTINMIFSPRQV